MTTETRARDESPPAPRARSPPPATLEDALDACLTMETDARARGTRRGRDRGTSPERRGGARARVSEGFELAEEAGHYAGARRCGERRAGDARGMRRRMDSARGRSE